MKASVFCLVHELSPSLNFCALGGTEILFYLGLKKPSSIIDIFGVISKICSLVVSLYRTVSNYNYFQKMPTMFYTIVKNYIFLLLFTLAGVTDPLACNRYLPQITPKMTSAQVVGETSDNKTRFTVSQNHTCPRSLILLG